MSFMLYQKRIIKNLDFSTTKISDVIKSDALHDKLRNNCFKK